MSELKQSAQGSYIAQASEGSTAIVNITQDAHLKSIPAVAPPPQNFVGRQDVIIALQNLLIKNRNQSQTILAIVGMGGIGKTAIVKKLSASLKENFPGGVFWASLSDTNGNPLPILHTWALFCAYELANDLDPPTISTIVRGLLTDRERELGSILLVIDDVRKQWLDASSLLKETLPPTGIMLLTTRDEYLTQALNAEIFHLDVLKPEESIELLATLIGKEVINRNKQEALRVVDLLGHLPLAIELAGKKLARLLRKPGYELSNLRAEVETYASNALILPGHIGLASTFSVTYDSLDNLPKRVFRWLGCFASGPILKTDVLGTIKAGDLLSIDETALESILDDLVQLSLINWGFVAGSYTLHPLLQQYAQALLNKEQEEEIAYEAHISFFASFFHGWTGDAKTTFQQIESRLANFLLTAERAYQSKDNFRFIQLAKFLGRTDGYLYLRGYWDEASLLLSRGYEICESNQDTNTAREILWHLGTMKREKGQYAEAKKLLQLSVEKDEIANDGYTLANSLFGLGYVHLYLAEYQSAETVLKRAADLAREKDNNYALGESLRGLGRVYLSQNDLKNARIFFEESIPVLEQSQNDQGLVYAMRGLGETLLLQNQIQESLNILSKALHLAEELQDKQAIGYTLRALGNLHVATKEYLLAKDVYSKCMNICRVIGETGSLAATQCLLADVLLQLGELNEAEQLYQQGRSSSVSLGLNRWMARADFGLAKVHYQQGKKKDAFNLAGNSLSVLKSLKHREAEMVQRWIKERYEQV